MPTDGIADLEARRLQTLDELGVLNLDADPVLDGLVRCAARLVDTPIALVTLIDAGQQWHKAREGLDMPALPRAHAFCRHNLLGEDIMEVSDLTRDERFHANPLVLDEPHIRFYAGVPLRVDGVTLGSLCVLDRRPRSLTLEQHASLHDLAKAAVARLQELRAQRKCERVHHELQEHRLHLEDIVERRTHALEQAREVAEAPVEIARLVQGLCDGLGMAAAERNVSVSCALDDALPGWMLTDGARLRQVLNNLVGNAIKFSGGQPRGGTVAVLVDAPRPDRLRIQVVDNGIGMTPEVMSRIFRPFVQGEESTTRRFGGTGLGLSICHRLTQLLGGDISVHSAPGRGATFTLHLPLNVVAQPAQAGDHAGGPGDDDVADVDFDVLPEMFDGDQQLAAEFRARFIPLARADLELIEATLREGAWSQMRDLAHRIKSSCRLVGARRMAALCDAIESCRADLDRRQIESLVDRLRRQGESVLRLLGETAGESVAGAAPERQTSNAPKQTP